MLNEIRIQFKNELEKSWKNKNIIDTLIVKAIGKTKDKNTTM